MRYKPPTYSWEPPELLPGELYALRALYAGVANEGQQKLALQVIMVKFSGPDDWAYKHDRAGGERDTLIALGRQFVGHRIREALTRPLPQTTEGGKDAGTSPKSTPSPESPTARARRNPKPGSKPDA